MKDNIEEKWKCIEGYEGMSKKKAILIGNGMSSQLISEYQNEKMIDIFISINAELYKSIDDLLVSYRDLKIKDQKNITDLLEHDGISYDHYHRYFVEKHLNQALINDRIEDIETLIKVSKLFRHKINLPIQKIVSIAKNIIYNGGRNGIADCAKKLNKKNFKKYVNSFDYIFTTNYDNILDDVYEKEVYHLHGGFRYYKQCTDNARFINKSENTLSPDKAYLLFGDDGGTKVDKMIGGSTGAFTFPYIFGASILQSYMNHLRDKEYDEIYIFGYSGQNDNHINEAIKSKQGITIIFYVNPELVTDKEEKERICNLIGNNNLELRSWDEIWKEILY